MTGSETTQSPAAAPVAKQRTTAAEYLSHQAAEAVQANQKIEVLDKIRTSNMIFSGQKLLHRLALLKQNFQFGLPIKEESVSLPDDTIQFDCKTETHHHHAPATAQAAGMGTLAKLAATAMLASGVGAPLSIAAWNLPEILKALNPPAQITQPAATGDIWSQYDLVVGPPKASEKELP